MRAATRGHCRTKALSASCSCLIFSLFRGLRICSHVTEHASCMSIVSRALMAPPAGHSGHWLPVEPERVLNPLVFASDFGVKRIPPAAGRDATYEEMDQGSSVKTWACAATAATSGGGGSESDDSDVGDGDR